MTMQESRKFSVHPAVIFQVIYAQAGTLSKAVLECLMNSVDAEASEVTVDVTNTGISIKDNGRGFQTKEQIEQWFEVFGFPHQEGDRIYGQFGMGRGQLWAFARTVWYTNEFVMDVDIKARGLDYTLSLSDKPYKGVHIAGQFYEALSNVELEAFKRELVELAKYLQIPVKLNNKTITQSMKDEKWTHETDEAYILLKPNSREMAVYNLGVLVRKYHAHSFGGVGGLVITKPGVRLMLNMARNDVLISQCPVWKKIKPYIVQTAEKERPANKRLGVEELQSIAMAAVASECPAETLASVKLVTNVSGKSETLGDFLDHANVGNCNGLLCAAPRGNKRGVKLHERKLAYVLSEETLERFGVSTVSEFVEQVRSLLEPFAAAQYQPVANRWFSWHQDTSILKAEVLPARDVYAAAPTLAAEMAYQANLRNRVMSVSDEFDFASRNLKETHELVKPKNATERFLLQFAQRVTNLARDIVSTELGERLDYREAFLGDSEVAQAWTDGQRWVAYRTDMVKNLSKGFSHWVLLMNLAVHEFLHHNADLDSHMHDEVFMERYHECMLGVSYQKNLDSLMTCYALFLAGCEKKDIRRPKTALVCADKLGIEVDRVAAQVQEIEQADSPPTPLQAPASAAVTLPELGLSGTGLEAFKVDSSLSTEEFIARAEAFLTRVRQELAG